MEDAEAQRNIVLDDLRRLLNQLRMKHEPKTRLFPPSALYASSISWTRHVIQHDLWQRALLLADTGKVSEFDTWLWGHYFGLSSGFAWPATEVQHRAGVGRYALYSAIERTTQAVAGTFLASAKLAVKQCPFDRSELEEGVASVLATATAIAHPRLDEIKRALETFLREVEPLVPLRVVRRELRSGGSRSLKTTRHTPVTRNAVYNAAHLARARRLSIPNMHRRNAILPLWTPSGESLIDDAQVLIEEIKRWHGTNDRIKVWHLLQDSHRILLNRASDQDVAIELLMLEVAVMRDHFNLAGIVPLDILEQLIPVSDPRRVSIARERAHLLQVHHLRRASLTWLDIANKRISNPAIRWPSRDDRLIEAARNMERLTGLASEINALEPMRRGYDLYRIQGQTRKYLDDVEDRNRVVEWDHIAEKRILESKLWTKIADQRRRIDARWDDGELLQVARIDESVRKLNMPVRELAWSTRQLSILLASDRPADFTDAARRASQLAIKYGDAWPNQVTRLNGFLQAAQLKRQRSWNLHKADIAELCFRLPADTDSTLRNPATLPRDLTVHGIPMR